MARGYHRRQDEQWRRTRKVVATLWNVNGGYKGKAMLEADIYRLASDDAPDVDMPTPEETEALWSELDELDKDLIAPQLAKPD